MSEGPHVTPDQVPEEARLEGPSYAPVPPIPQDAEWRRLDARMLLVHPVNELIRFLPVLIGIFVLGSSSDGELWQLIGVAIPVTLGVMRFFTTRFRITASQIELQRGLLSRSVLTAKLDRVRAVQLTSSPIHRVLGLAKVEIGTASGVKDDDESFALDSLAIPEAREMRVALLHRAEPSAEGEEPAGAAEDDVLLTLDPVGPSTHP